MARVANCMKRFLNPSETMAKIQIDLIVNEILVTKFLDVNFSIN